MKKFAIALAMILSLPVMAQNSPQWLVVAEASEFKDEGLVGSGEVSKNAAGETIGVFTARRVSKVANRIDFYKWYVTENDCVRRAGKLVALTLSGDFKFDVDVVMSQQTVGANLANMACYTVMNRRKAQEALSIDSAALTNPDVFNWLKFSDMPEFFDEMLATSHTFAKNNAGTIVSVVTGRRTIKKTGESEVTRWYVSAEDCGSGTGKLVTLTPRGKFMYSNDYMKNGGTVASDIGDLICSVAENSTSKKSPVQQEQRRDSGKKIEL